MLAQASKGSSPPKMDARGGEMRAHLRGRMAPPEKTRLGQYRTGHRKVGARTHVCARSVPDSA
eukprot:1543374-Rhodomonas_salina.1